MANVQPATPAFQAYEAQYNWPYDYLSIVEAVKVDVDILYDDESNRARSLVQEGLTMPGYSSPGGLLDDDGGYPGGELDASDVLDLLGGNERPTFSMSRADVSQTPTTAVRKTYDVD